MWDFPLFPSQGSTTAGHVDALMLFELGIAFLFTFLVLALIVGFGLRYRRGRQVDRSAPPTHGVRLELLMIVPPALISLVMFGWGARVFFEIYSPPADAVTIKVVGLQWMWKLMHPEGKQEINELHIPVGQAVKLEMTSQDVIHSFFVPAFRVKQDVLPGRETTLWFRPERPGKYHLHCAEYCGTEHSYMGGWVYVMEPADYQRWLEEGATSGLAEQGRELFVAHHCAGCHGPTQTVRAPRLEGVAGKPVPIMGDDGVVRPVMADYRYLRDSILMPRSEVVAGYEPVMPSFAGQIPEDDLQKLLAYIESIGSEPAEPEPAAQARARADARARAPMDANP